MTSLPPAGDQPRATDLPTSGPAFSPIGAIDGPPTERVSGPRRPGWLLPVAGLAGVLLVGALAVVVFLNLNPTAASDAARTGYAYLPANSLMAFEARLDMPAGQREQFFGFVSRFPGMGDAAQLEQRMNQLLNEAIGSATSGVANYSDDVEPWFSGWIVAGAQVRPGGELEESGEVVAVLGSTDRARAELGLERLRGRGSWVSQAGPNGTTIWTNAGGAAPASGAYAATDDAVVVGTDAAAVSAAIETRSAGSGSLLDDESFAASYARQPAGRLASFWLDYAAVQQIIEQQADDLPGMENPFEFTCAAFPMPVSMTGCGAPSAPSTATSTTVLPSFM